ncbi:hypothetical protein, partial [Pseudomonas viridiflava]|uniref:hypothetical protein n=1 Tax=Pseudomonas viridiflava TaxID=33069 RepID=UPI0019D17F92
LTLRRNNRVLRGGLLHPFRMTGTRGRRRAVSLHSLPFHQSLFNDANYGWHVVAGGGKDGNDRYLCPVGQPLKCRGTLDACDDVIQLTPQPPGIEYLLEQFFSGLLEIIRPALIFSRPV